MLQYQIDGEGYPIFTVTRDLIVDPTRTSKKTLNQMAVSFQNDVLSVKSTYNPYLFIAKICKVNESYNAKTFQCEACQSNLRSFGIQMNYCDSCSELWVQNYQDQFKLAQQSSMCIQTQSWTLCIIAITVGVGLLASFLMLFWQSFCYGALSEKIKEYKVEQVKVQARQIPVP